MISSTFFSTTVEIRAKWTTQIIENEDFSTWMLPGQTSRMLSTPNNI